MKGGRISTKSFSECHTYIKFGEQFFFFFFNLMFISKLHLVLRDTFILSHHKNKHYSKSVLLFKSSSTVTESAATGVRLRTNCLEFYRYKFLVRIYYLQRRVSISELTTLF
jgi:hypothetical protein